MEIKITKQIFENISQTCRLRLIELIDDDGSTRMLCGVRKAGEIKHNCEINLCPLLKEY